MSTQTQIVSAKSAEEQAISATMAKAARRPAWGLTIGALIALIAFAMEMGLRALQRRLTPWHGEGQ